MGKDLREGWLAKLKSGDPIIVNSDINLTESKSIKRIKRITPTGRIIVWDKKNCDSESTFDQSGKLMGYVGFYGCRLKEATPENIKETKEYNLKRNIIYKITKTNFSNFDLEDLKVIYTIIKKYEVVNDK